jgi:hypothetical protein
MMPRQRKKTAIDFGDEEAVLEDVAKALETDIEELSIEEASGLSGFGEGTIYLVSEGRIEYNIAENHDQAYALAVAVVKQDLEQEPEIFNKEFIESHINTDKLRDELRHDVLDFRIEDLTDDAERDPERFWKDYEREGFEAPEENEDGERHEPTSSQIEELAEKHADSLLEDPMEYLEDSVGKDEAVKEAIRIAGIDINAAADDAVDTDGWEHFLARYDGNAHETGSGLVYWRVN